MKPILKNENGSERFQSSCFPITDYNYHSVALDGHNGCSQKVSPSFLNISREYFKTEARQSFLAESAYFAAIVVTAAWPVAYGIYLVAHLMRMSGAI